jgi:outer membrane receptor for ferrienterochelin and colicins
MPANRPLPFTLATPAVALCAVFSPAGAQEPERLDRVEVTSERTARPGSLRNDIVKTESIGASEIARSNATNINEAVDNRPGIAVQVECSVCNVRNVLLNNLPGRFTTLLIDGVPIYSSVSSAYGLDSVSVWGVERIDVARGAGASLIAPEALSGTVSIVTARPTSAEARGRLQLASFGSRQADAYLGRPFSGGALVVGANYNRHDTIDGNGDRISEFTGFDRWMGNLGLFLDDVGGFRVRSRLDAIREHRGGGAMGRDYDTIKASLSGNPFDFSRSPSGAPVANGWINPSDPANPVTYDAGLGGFSEIIFTDRVQWIGTGERRVGGGTLRLAFGAAQHKQDSFYEGDTYIATQYQYYAEASFRKNVGWAFVTAGVNWRYEDLKSRGVLQQVTPVDGLDNYVYRTPAAFLQLYRAFFDDRLEINGSVRHDRNNVFGGITSPRINALYHHTPALSSRLSAGRGFRLPTSFFEQDHGILATTRIDREIRDAEKSDNASYALSWVGDRFDLTVSANYTRIRNFAVLDSGATDPLTGAPITLFTTAPDPVTVQGADIVGSYQAAPGLRLSGGAEAFDYRFAPGTLVFARPDWKAYVSADWALGAWDLSTRLTVTGPSDLDRFHEIDGADPATWRYNFDGTRKRSRSPTFATLDLRAERRIGARLSVFFGADNVTDYKQIDRENFLWVGFDGGYDVTHIWGPSRGRYVYAGIKAQL